MNFIGQDAAEAIASLKVGPNVDDRESYSNASKSNTSTSSISRTTYKNSEFSCKSKSIWTSNCGYEGKESDSTIAGRE